ncbi:MAG: permease-like cell division protein FtsX [Oscillospiraceae bacterium]|jgi:cell division transport system permease protein|nr:permease-like cell division protein FtsX [Oscillospiraceae bacterium]
MGSFFSKIGYVMREGITGVFINGFMSFASVFVIAACLLITGSFALLSLNINNIIGNLENQYEIVAFVNEELSDEEARALQPRIEAIDGVQAAEFTSRKQAYEDYVATYGDTLRSLFDEVNPDVFRDRYAITLVDISKAAELQYGLLSVDGGGKIVKVNAYLEISNGFVALENIVTFVCGALIVVLFIVSIFMMSNTVKLSTFSRREEIAIMRMVGATSGFIRRPFVIEGVILGLMGSAIAYMAQWAVYMFALDRAASSNLPGFITLLPFKVVALPVLAVFAGVGLIIGAGGSANAIRNYLKI